MNLSELNPVICGTDFSQNASQAALVADALAKRLHAPFTLVHSADERGYFPEHVRGQVLENDARPMAEHVAQLRALGLTFQEILISGAPKDGVASYAAQKAARLIVVGASGSGSLWPGGRWLLGDVAEQIAETSSVPTLVVRAAGPFLAWMRAERPLKIFIAADFTETSEAALRWVAEFQRAAPCEITLGYIHRMPVERGDLAALDALGKTHLPALVRAGLEQDLLEKGSRLLGVPPTIRVELEVARVDAHLIALATEAEADLLVLGSHQWHDMQRVWHTSISRRVLHDAPMSVACVPVPTAPGGTALPRISRVLVAADFSDHGENAVSYAYATVAAGGIVCLFHAIQPDDPEQKTRVEDRLRALVPAQAQSKGVVTEMRVVEASDTGTAICEAADHFGAELVCVGSHAHSRLAATALGSSAQAVIAQCTRPVLVVRLPSP